MNLLSTLCVSAAACSMSAAALAAPVFLEASVTAAATARASYTDAYQVDQHSAGFAGPTGSHRVSAGVYAGRPDLGAQVLVSQDIEAVMNGESAGTVAMSSSMVARNPLMGNMGFGDASGFHYNFRADADGLLRVRYQVQADPLVVNTTSYEAFLVWLRRPGPNNDFLGRLSADSAGLFSLALDAGEVYELVIETGGTFGTLTQDVTRSFSGFFEWSIEDLPAVQAVPEPGGLWLVLTALGALVAGTGLRGRDRAKVR